MAASRNRAASTRAPKSRVLVVDVGELTNAEALTELNRLMADFRRRIGNYLTTAGESAEAADEGVMLGVKVRDIISHWKTRYSNPRGIDFMLSDLVEYAGDHAARCGWDGADGASARPRGAGALVPVHGVAGLPDEPVGEREPADGPATA